MEFLEGAAAVPVPPQVPPKSPEVESPEVEFLEDAAALTDGEEDDGEETEDLGSGVQKKPAAGWCVAEREGPSGTRVSAGLSARVLLLEDTVGQVARQLDVLNGRPPRPPDEVPTLPTRGQR